MLNLEDRVMSNESSAVVDINSLTSKVAEVVAVTDEYEAAIALERDAEVQLLTAVIEVVRPGLRAICSRLLKREACTGGRDGCNPVEKKEYFEQRGIILVEDFRRVRDETGNEGTYEGRALALLATGELAIITREGTWSLWQGSWNREEHTMKCVTVAEAMNTFDADDCVAALRNALDKQLNSKRQEATKAALARAEQLRAIAALVK
jgi:hypothetical protein